MIFDIFSAGLGFVLGCIVTWIIHKSGRVAGTFLIDSSNPKKDVYRFEITNLDILKRKKRITLKVNKNAYFSHE